MRSASFQPLMRSTRVEFCCPKGPATRREAGGRGRTFRDNVMANGVNKTVARYFQDVRRGATLFQTHLPASSSTRPPSSAPNAHLCARTSALVTSTERKLAQAHAQGILTVHNVKLSFTCSGLSLTGILTNNDVLRGVIINPCQRRVRCERLLKRMTAASKFCVPLLQTRTSGFRVNARLVDLFIRHPICRRSLTATAPYVRDHLVNSSLYAVDRSRQRHLLPSDVLQFALSASLVFLDRLRVTKRLNSILTG